MIEDQEFNLFQKEYNLSEARSSKNPKFKKKIVRKYPQPWKVN